jgi:GNAT superfamily N-acetyltransferase
MLELTSKIWDGEDYIKYVWDDWLADPEGALLVAEPQELGPASRMIGLGKLTRLSEEDWWLEGLRVHPDFEGRGVGTQIFQALLAAWGNKAGSRVRLATSIKRLAVHQMCARLGFHKIDELAWFKAPSTSQAEKPANFQPATAGQAAESLEFAQTSESLALWGGLMNMFWRWAPPRRVYFDEAITHQRCWWWRERAGQLHSFQDDGGDSGESTALLQLIACSSAALEECLLDFRELAGRNGCKSAACAAPLEARLIQALSAAGYEQIQDHRLLIFEKQGE